MRQDARTALRAATAPAHERLDALFAGFDLASPAGYRRFLTAHAMALPPLETALDARRFAGELADWPERRRADVLASDLVALGVDLPAPLAPLPSLDSAAARWGAAYVLEGSRLGGAMLARRVPEGLPRGYLAQPQPAGGWRRFLEAMEHALAAPASLDAAVASAAASFDFFARAGAMLAEPHDA